SCPWWRLREGRSSLLFLLLTLDGTRPGLRLTAHQGEVLAQWVTLERFGQEQLQRLRMALERDPEHLDRLALVPVRGRVEVGDRGTDRILVWQPHLHAHVVVMCGREQVRDDLEPGVGPEIHGTREVAVVA